MFSSRGLCDELITRPDESYRLWSVVVCDLETSCMRRPWPSGGCCAKNKQRNTSDIISAVQVCSDSFVQSTVDTVRTFFSEYITLILTT